MKIKEKKNFPIAYSKAYFISLSN